MSTWSADPVVAGLGFAAVRDFASYAKHAPDAIHANIARIRRGHFAEWPVPARFSLRGIQR